MRSFEEVVYALIEDRALHARFANTLSLLEYLGARKILKSQKSENVSSEVLAHASEEIRHARVFKRLALKLSDGKLDTYGDEHLVAGREAKNYIHGVDEACAEELLTRCEWKNYLLTTLLIEERAMEVYPLYERILREKDIPNAVGTVVRDEDSHLSAVRSALETETDSRAAWNHLRAIERGLFDHFLDAVLP